MPVSVEIYYQVHEGWETTPLVLLHGAGGSHLSWPPGMRRLAGYSVYALDLPGHGNSPGRGQQSIEGYLTAVQDWMQSIGLFRAVFVGHSMGGAIAQMLALDTPQRVIGLCLIGTAARLAVNPKLLAAAGSVSEYQRALQNIVEWSFSKDTVERLKELVSKRMAEVRPSVLHGDLIASDGFDMTGKVSGIKCPTLVLCGAEDRMTPVRHSQFLADHIPRARLEIVPGAGPMVMLEEPEAVTEFLRQFVSKLEF